MQRKWVVTGWATAAAVAVAAGIGAVAVAQGGTLDSPSEPLSQQEALEELESSPTDTPDVSASPSPEASESPAPTGELDTVPSDDAGTDEQAIAVEGGTITARCAADGQVELVWWVAAQGWQISSVDPGPGEDAEIEFEADDEIEYTIVCVDGVPHSSTDDDDDDDDD